MTDIAIRVENCILSRVEGLSKLYRIGRAQQRHDTLRDALVSTFQRSNVPTFKRLKILSRITGPTGGRAETRINRLTPAHAQGRMPMFNLNDWMCAVRWQYDTNST